MNKMRQKIYDKMGGRCAYCGCCLPESGWHEDHISPIYRNRKKKPEHAGHDELNNKFPSCARCNRWKKVFTVEQFREEIEKQVERLSRDSASFRLAEDYGLIKATGDSVKFYFERVKVV